VSAGEQLTRPAPGEHCGFAVIYRFRVRSGLEPQFIAAWERATHAIRSLRGGLGSRLHRAADGSLIAYAQWPSREAWERSRAAEPADREASALMREAIAESDPPLLLDPISDLLVRTER
jgi:heme-degrading monooxygenase HmoA